MPGRAPNHHQQRRGNVAKEKSAKGHKALSATWFFVPFVPSHKHVRNRDVWQTRAKGMQ